MANLTRRGGRSTPRKGFKNSTFAKAQKRIYEAVQPMHRKNENALKVEGLQVLVFKQTALAYGRPCSCQSHAYSAEEHSPLLDDDDLVEQPQEKIINENSPYAGMTFETRNTDILGDISVAHKGIDHGDTNTKITDLGDIDFKVEKDSDIEAAIEGLDPELQAYYRDSIHGGSSVNCGVCYRKGNDPAFTCHDNMIETLTPLKSVELIGYAIEEDQKPNAFMKVADEGKVIFEITIPKYFKKMTYSVRDNTDVLTFNHIFDLGSNDLVTMSDLNKHRGKTYRFYVESDHFTHVSILFDLGLDPVYSNVSEMGNRWDAETEDTSGGLTFALPARVGEVKAGDVIYVPDRRKSYMITDAPRKELVNRTIIEWVVSTRIIQNHEALRYIARGYNVE